MAIHQAHTKKPDPDEPWRYVCPDCKGHIFSRSKNRKRPYECIDCGHTHNVRELYDKKRDVVGGFYQ